MTAERPKRQTKDEALRENDLVHNIISEPGQAGNAILLMGYIGKSSVEDAARIYINLNLDEYFDVPKESILHAASAPEEVLPFGGTYIWIRKDADITHSRIDSTKVQAKFLEGRLASRLLEPSRPHIEGPVTEARPKTLPRITCTVECFGLIPPQSLEPLRGICGVTTIPSGCVRSEDIPCIPTTRPAGCVPPRPTTPAAGCVPPRPTTRLAGCVPSEDIPCRSVDIPCHSVRFLICPVDPQEPFEG